MNNSPRDAEVRQWAMVLHFSLLAGIVTPSIWIVTIIIWQVKKNDLPELNPHGKIVANWIISVLIYGAVGLALMWIVSKMAISSVRGDYTGGSLLSSFEVLGIFMGIIGLLNIIFPIMGGLKAKNGEVWEYPLSLRILR